MADNAHLSEAQRNTEGRIKQAKMHVYGGVAVVALMAAMLIIAGVLLLLPYRPMTVYSYTPDVREACPNEVVGVHVDYEVQEGANIDSMDVRAGWTAIDVPGYSSGSEVYLTRATFSAPDDYFEAGRHNRETRAPRVTPVIPGVWQPTSETTVRGWRYGVPHVQTVRGSQYEGDYPLTVLPESSKECS